MPRNFRIDWVFDQDLPDLSKRRTSTGFKTVCPFCQKKDKFDVNTSKGLARCNACGKGFNALTLHSALCGVDTKTAYKDLWDRYNGLSSELKAQVDKPVVVKEKKPLPLWVRNIIYRRFLNKLTLKPHHKANLLARGLSEEKIDTFRYKSVPERELDMTEDLEILKSLNGDKFPNISSIELAGFEWKNGRFVATPRKSGILIPIIIRNPLGSDYEINRNLISGFQIRFDEGEKRYTCYSGEGQFTGYQSVHMRLPLDASEIKRVIITEGGLKSDVASSLSNDTPFIAVLGVNNTRWLLPTLKMLKKYYNTEQVVFAFDMDSLDNVNVQNALEKAKKICSDAGLIVNECAWKQEYRSKGIKGIDDLLLYRANNTRRNP